MRITKATTSARGPHHATRSVPVTRSQSGHSNRASAFQGRAKTVRSSANHAKLHTHSRRHLTESTEVKPPLVYDSEGLAHMEQQFLKMKKSGTLHQSSLLSHIIYGYKRLDAYDKLAPFLEQKIQESANYKGEHTAAHELEIFVAAQDYAFVAATLNKPHQQFLSFLEDNFHSPVKDVGMHLSEARYFLVGENATDNDALQVTTEKVKKTTAKVDKLDHSPNHEFIHGISQLYLGELNQLLLSNQTDASSAQQQFDRSLALLTKSQGISDDTAAPFLLELRQEQSSSTEGAAKRL